MPSLTQTQNHENAEEPLEGKRSQAEERLVPYSPTEGRGRKDRAVDEGWHDRRQRSLG